VYCCTICGRNWFTVDVRVEGFVTVEEDGRKSYTRGFSLSWIVDPDCFSMDFIRQSLARSITWGKDQSVVVWFFDKAKGEDCKLSDDIQIRLLFEMYERENKFSLLIGVYDNSKIFEIDGEPNIYVPICVVPPDPIAGKAASATGVAVSEVAATKEADATEPENPFDNDEEYVGVNDEHIYEEYVPPAPPTQAPNLDEAATSSHFDVPFESNDISAEAEINDEDPEAVNVLHDPENPVIAKGVLFPDIITFRKAVRHYAIKTGFAFKNLKTDPTRFIASCAHEGCPWRIHASRLPDGCTIKVSY